MSDAVNGAPRSYAHAATRRRRASGFAAVLAGVCAIAWLAGTATPARAAVEDRARAERRVALVVGNGRYPRAPLANPENDARLIASRLRELGFEVREHLNLGTREFRGAVRTFVNEMQDTPGVVLFYYAGHGVQIAGRNYLLPVDVNLSSEADVKDDSIDVDALFVSRLESIRAQTRIVILDACRDNPFGRRTRNIRAAGGLAEMTARGTLIAYASAPGATAEDGPSGSNSVYTRHLAEQMMAPGLDVELMFKRVRIRVLQDTRDRQVPWVNTSLTTNFAFRERVGPDPAELARNAHLRKLEEALASTRAMLQQARERADRAEAVQVAARTAQAQSNATAAQAVPPPASTTSAALETSPGGAWPSAAPTASAAAATSPTAMSAPSVSGAPVAMPVPVPVPVPVPPTAAPPVSIASAPASAADAARAQEAKSARREVDRLLEQLLVAESAVAAARESSRLDAIRRAAAPPPPPVVVAAPRARPPNKAERCADLLTRMSIGDAIGAESERFLSQECK
ncbi:MAG: caspase domain-containing protein [Lautropia sp.]